MAGEEAVAEEAEEEAMTAVLAVAEEAAEEDREADAVLAVEEETAATAIKAGLAIKTATTTGKADHKKTILLLTDFLFPM